MHAVISINFQGQTNVGPSPLPLLLLLLLPLGSVEPGCATTAIAIVLVDCFGSGDRAPNQPITLACPGP